MTTFRLHGRVLGLLIATALFTGALTGLSAGTADAAGSPYIYAATQGIGCTYVQNGPSGQQNLPLPGNGQVQIAGQNFHNGVNVWYGVQDLSTGVWYGGWTLTGPWVLDLAAHLAGDCSTMNFARDITIPLTSCGHQMRADATDSDGTATNEARFALKCTSHPSIQITQTPNTPSQLLRQGQVIMTGSFLLPYSAHVWYGVQDLTTGVWYGGWTSADQYGSFTWISTNIPASACGHGFRADATDNGVAPGAGSNEVAFGLSCGPTLGATTNSLFGGSYTPGGLVKINTLDTDTGVASPITLIADHFGRFNIPAYWTCDHYTVTAQDAISGQWAIPLRTGGPCIS